MTMSPDQHSGTFRGCIPDVFFDLLHRDLIDQRSLRGARLEASSGFERLDGRGELRGKGIVNAILHQEAVRTNAGLAAVSVFRSNGALDGRVQISVVKDDKGGIASKFERQLLYGAGTLGHQKLADFCRSGEGKFSYGRVGSEFPADFACLAGDYVENALRD